VSCLVTAGSTGCSVTWLPVARGRCRQLTARTALTRQARPDHVDRRRSLCNRHWWIHQGSTRLRRGLV